MRFSFKYHKFGEKKPSKWGKSLRYSKYTACVADPAAQSHFASAAFWTTKRAWDLTVFFAGGW